MIRWLILAIALIALLVAPRGETSPLNPPNDAARKHYVATASNPNAF